MKLIFQRILRLRGGAILRHAAAALLAGGSAFLLRSEPRPARAEAGSASGAALADTSSAAQPPLPVPEGSEGLPGFLTALRTAGPAQLQAAFLATREPALREAITIRWGTVDPAGCWRFLQECAEQRVRDQTPWWRCMPLLVEQWVKTDPQAAREALAGRRSTESNALAALLRATAREGGRAWQELLADPRFLTMRPAMSDAPVLPEEPGTLPIAMASLDEAWRQGRRGLFFTGRNHLAGSGGSREAQQVRRSYEEMAPGSRHWFAADVAEGLARQDPGEAVKFLGALDPVQREQAGPRVAAAYAKKDPAAAWQWLTTNLQGSRRNAAEAWGRGVDPAAGAEMLAAQPSSLLRDAALAGLSEQWIRTDASAAAAWAGSLTDPDARRAAVRSMAPVLAKEDPQAALEMLTAPEAPTLSRDAYRAVAAALHRSDPALAEEYIRRLPPVAAQIAAGALPKPPESSLR